MTLKYIIEYAKTLNIDIFADIKLTSELDKEVMINTIIDDCGDYDPIVFELVSLNNKIKNFFERHYLDIEKLTKAYNSDYDPLSNYDRVENTTNNNTAISDVSAFDSNDYQKDTKQSNTATTTSRVTGNIGVTTSQQMLESEFKLRQKYNIYKYVANMFFDELMLKFY